ncbi:MAG: hypothetical protein AAGF20_09610 [Pseudomonadota bacterium]
MTGFDREALVAAAEETKGGSDNLAFWGLVAALPILGAMVGAYFLMQKPKSPLPMAAGTVVAETEVDVAAPENAVKVAAEPAEPAWSSAMELAKYRDTRRAIRYCGTSEIIDYSLVSQSVRMYQQRNEARLDKVNAIKDAEYKAAASDRRADFEKQHREMMFKMMTGQAQMEALKMSMEMEKMRREGFKQTPVAPRPTGTPKEILHFFSGEPDLGKCSMLRADMQRGRYDITLPKRRPS